MREIAIKAIAALNDRISDCTGMEDVHVEYRFWLIIKREQIKARFLRRIS